MKFHQLMICLYASWLVAACTYEEKQVSDAQSATKSTLAIMLLPDWERAPRERILRWIQAVTEANSEDFIPVADRIAVFDNDGTLWPEQPYPNQMQYCIDYVKARWDEYPAWEKDSVLKGWLVVDMKEDFRKIFAFE